MIGETKSNRRHQSDAEGKREAFAFLQSGPESTAHRLGYIRKLLDNVSQNYILARLIRDLAPQSSFEVPWRGNSMTTPVTTKQEIARIVGRFAADQPAALAAYLFGSAVQERLTTDSDVDVGILFITQPDGLRLLELQEDLSALLGRQADLVSLNQVSPFLGMQVLKHGEIVFERSARATREFQVRTMLAYWDLKQVRKPIEHAQLSG